MSCFLCNSFLFLQNWHSFVPLNLLTDFISIYREKFATLKGDQRDWMLNQRWPKHAKIPNFSVLTFPPLWDQRLPKRKDVWSEVWQFWPLRSDHTKLWFYCFLKGELPHRDPQQHNQTVWYTVIKKKANLSITHMKRSTNHPTPPTRNTSEEQSHNLQLSALPVWSAIFHNPITPSWLYVGGYYGAANKSTSP